ncbi:ABC transporter permease [Amnibacterium sp.]|uniref:ABC transporter permease n=1 Tax=Amnibacterium sp. TaxID=1872496 RepID=UPI0026037F97|nr:ABC transporter permease subunit [Amnibacterium sp.]MCU1472064.1 transporter permease [Amnibacterium sp.]
MDWVWSHAGDLWSLVLTHVGLSVPPIVLGFVISVPLGYWASRSAAARAVLLTLGNVLYTIPSLAFILLVPVVLGFALLDAKNVLVALTVYAIAIMVRSAADAFASVSASVRESAVAQGFSPAQRFLRVELPLAGPVLLAGVRVVSVSTVSLATIGSLAGIDSLGNLFTDGFQRDFAVEIITGIVLVLALAAVFDVVLSLVGRLLLPWSRRTGRGRVRRSAPAAASVSEQVA